jgi:hypothetical protein
MNLGPLPGSQRTEELFERFISVHNMIYMAMTATQILLYIVLAIIMAPKESIVDPETRSLLYIIVPIANFAAVASGALLYRLTVRKASQQTDMAKKLSKFQPAYIIRLALLESLGMLNIISFYLTADSKFQIFFVLVFMLFVITGYPSKSRIRKELDIGIAE